jgi:hypothetical protein
MDANGIGVWLNWGEGEDHGEGTSDVGIKAARQLVDS